MNLSSEITSVKNKIVECRDNLKQILIDKKIEGLESENKLSVLIDKVNLFDKYIPSKISIYDNGTTDNGNFISAYSNAGIYEMREDNIYLQSRIALYNDFCIDVTLYKKLYCELSVTATAHENYIPVAYCDVGLYSSTASNYAFTSYVRKVGGGGRVICELDITGVVGNQYVKVYCHHHYDGNNYNGVAIRSLANIHKIWLER